VTNKLKNQVKLSDPPS